MRKTFLSTLVFFVALVSLFLSVDSGDYPNLDSCFKASVSKKLICDKSKDYVRLGSVSKHFLNAVVMSEDDSFYDHDGFDWTEFRRSMATNLRQFSFVRGGSTITQQLVKNVYLNQKKTVVRKIVEAKLAAKIEREHSKKIILEKYINAIEFGKNIWGLKSASRFYFDKPPALLDPLESLYLTILLPSPVRYSQTFFKKELSAYQRKRMGRLLRRMKKRGFVSEEEFKLSKQNLNSFFRKPVEQPVKIEVQDWAESAEEAKVVLPEDGELEDTDLDPAEYEDVGGQIKLTEESYSEEQIKVEDIEFEKKLEDVTEDESDEIQDQP